LVNHTNPNHATAKLMALHMAHRGEEENCYHSRMR
jgi:hypothetical protein